MEDDAGSHARRTSAWDLVQRRSSGEHSHRVGMEDKGRASHSSPSSAPVASLSQSLAPVASSLLDTGAEMNGRWRERSEGG
jgi:hypothetical protein